MLSLPIHRDLEYFSPTSYMETNCEYSFYLTRMSEYLFPKMKQTEAMAIGCAFDAFCKAELAYSLGKTSERKNLLAVLLQTVEEHNEHLISKGNELFELYNRWGLFDKLLEEGIEDVELVIHSSLPVVGSVGNLGDVKLFGKPDAKLSGRKPLDWKVSGYGSRTGQSPKPGYYRCLFGPGQDKGIHPKFGQPLELIDERWATQLVFYNWMQGNDTLDMSGRIDQAAIRPGVVAFASYNAKISPEFITTLRTDLTDKWQRFKQGLFKEPVPTREICEPYQQPRVCTIMCEYYKKIFHNDLIMGVG